MEARFVTVTVGPGQRDAMIALADANYHFTRSLPGFASATYFIFDEAKGVYGSMTLWERKAEAMAAGEKLRAWMEENARAKMTAPPEIRLAEVYQPT